MSGVLYRSGAYYGGVAAHPEGWVWCYLAEAVPAGQGTLLVCEVNGAIRWAKSLPEPCMELWMACSPAGVVRCLMKGHDTGTAYEVWDSGFIRTHGLCDGVQSVIVWWEDDRFIAGIFQAWADMPERNGVYWNRIDLLTGAELSRRYPGSSTSQGFLDVEPATGDPLDVNALGLPALVPVFADLRRQITVHGLTLSFPQARDGLTIGQLGDPTHPAQIAAIRDGETLPRDFTAILGGAFEPRLAALGEGRYVVNARTPQGAAAVLLPPYEPLVTSEPQPVDHPIGPLSPPRAEDGRLINLLPFVIGEADRWPRSGPSHSMNQAFGVVEGFGQILHFTKFGNPEAYESWGITPDWVLHLEDASGAEPYSFSDPRWFPAKMPIGEAHAFVTGPHMATFRQRHGCATIRTEPFDRRMWLYALYDEWDWGGLGIRPTILLAYDATAGIHTTPDGSVRGVELFYFAFGAGWCRWEYHDSKLVYAHGPARFDDSTRVSRSDFYLLGGQPLQPTLTGCVSAVVPSYPPWTPADPQLPPANPQPAKEPQMKLPARCFIHLPSGNIGTVAPGPFPRLDLAYATQEYGGFQEVEVTQSKTEPAKVLVRWIAADKRFQLDTVLAQQGKLDQAMGLAPGETDSAWQQGDAVGPYIHFRSDSPDGQNRHGIICTLTCVDGSGQLFR